MKELKLDNVIINLFAEGDTVKVKSDNENVILSNQTIENVSKLIQDNFKTARDHYNRKVNENIVILDLKDLDHLIFAIVIYYLYMYNSWRVMYKKQENRDLALKEDDLDNPSTHDIIFNHYKTKYPDDWDIRCSLLLGIELEELRLYYDNRKDFYNK